MFLSKVYNVVLRKWPAKPVILLFVIHTKVGKRNSFFSQFASQCVEADA